MRVPRAVSRNDVSPETESRPGSRRPPRARSTTVSSQPTVSNPLREGLPNQRSAPPASIVIFGASGDLTHRKLVPALYNLAVARLLPAEFAVIGFSRTKMTSEEFRASLLDGLKEHSRTQPIDPEIWESFSAGITYRPGGFDDAASYQELASDLIAMDQQRGTSGNRLFYMATPPSLFPIITKRLGEAGLNRGGVRGAFSRLIIEKPFGYDLPSAKALNRTIHGVFQERSVYRIDHYLGKETVQNLLALRFANGIFEPLWNRQYVDHVQITVAESVGVEDRGGYYDDAGAFRDVMANHMLQVLSVMAMEPPVVADAESIRDEKVKVLKALRPIRGTDVDRYTIRGQYTQGYVSGHQEPAYREEPSVKTDSATETFVALELYIDNWRWADTPFFLRHGKRLPKRVSEIAIHFKRPPKMFFASEEHLDPNVLVLRIQPNEGITLRFAAKVPGPTMRLRDVNMDFLYGSSFLRESPDAYERLLLDAMLGDTTLFIRADEVEQAWTWTDPIAERWAERPEGTLPYEAGTWGPDAALAMIDRDGLSWRRP